MLQSQKRWRQRIAPADVVAELEQELRLPSLAARLLVLRGVSTPDSAQRFLDKRLGGLHRPELMEGMDAAAERFARAINLREPILVHGDFDVDGSTAAALIKLFCRANSHNAAVWIPDRREDGYGLSEGSIRAVRDTGAKLMITVDCGITDHGLAARIEAECGCQVIVTDHHLPSGPLPVCTAVVNPNLPGSRYPDQGLAGVGVAWKLCWAAAVKLCGSERISDRLRAFLMDALALVAVGTVADCAPLADENRVLVHHGLKILETTSNRGLRALVAETKLGSPITADDVGWKLGPLLNASGRLGTALDNIRLLTIDDEGEIQSLIRGLIEQNDERRRLTEMLSGDLILETDSNPTYSQRSTLVFAGDGWHPGVIGIVASRLAERFHKPAAVIAIQDGEGRGSLRSAAGVHLGEAINACRHLLIKGGGHAQAAGITISAEQVDAFSQAFEDHVRRLHPDGMALPGIEHDGLAAISELDASFFSTLENMEPFGVGNPEPVLLLSQVYFAARPECFGKLGEHLRGALTDERGGLSQFYAWRAKAQVADFSIPRCRFELLVRPTLNRFRGSVQPRLVFVDGKCA